MLTAFQIRDFRCLRKVEVPLRPLTVLIGANDSGKSTFLHALSHFVNGSDIIKSEQWRAGNDQILLLGNVGEKTCTRRWTGPGSSYPLTGDATVVNRIQPIGFYQLPASGVSMISSGQAEESAPPNIARDGTQIPALIDYLLRNDRDRFDAFESALRELIPGLERIQLPTPEPAQRRLDFVIEGGFRISADQTSAGVRLLVFFVAMAFHPNPPKLIMIEEPETGLHPKRLGDVINLLRDITKGVHGGHTAQVILTTHSPYLLDLIDLEQDQVLVFSRQPDGSRMAKPADKDRLKLFLDEFMLGEVWFNQGEEGLVGQKAS